MMWWNTIYIKLRNTRTIDVPLLKCHVTRGKVRLGPKSFDMRFTTPTQIILKSLNLFHANGLFLYSLKRSENLCFYRIGMLSKITRKGLPWRQLKKHLINPSIPWESLTIGRPRSVIKRLKFVKMYWKKTNYF